METSSFSSIVFPSCVFFGIRCVCFVACRTWISSTLGRNVISTTSPPLRDPGDSSHDRDASSEEETSSGWIRLSSSSSGKRADGSILPTTRADTERTGEHHEKPRPPLSFASTVFCLSFSECCILFLLVLFGRSLDETPRNFNWSLSLGFVLVLVVILTPFMQCLLVTHQKSGSQSTFRLFVWTLIPYSLYLFIFYWLGGHLSDRLITAGSNPLRGILNTTLTRLLVPGVVLIAFLSGIGAVQTAWDAWQLRKNKQPVTEGHVMAAERALYRARMDLDNREKELDQAIRELDEAKKTGANQSFFSKMMSSSHPAAAKKSSLEMQISAMRALEGQLASDLTVIKMRRERVERAKTLGGKFAIVIGRGFEVYCAWRVFSASVNLLFGLSGSSNRSVDCDDGDSCSSEAPDAITRLLTLFLPSWLPVEMYSRVIGLVMIGSILIANLKNVMKVVDWGFRVTAGNGSRKRDGGSGHEFVVSTLSQVMVIYLLTSLISLPSSSSASRSLLTTLPSFAIFQRLFDGVFLVAATGCFAFHWVASQRAETLSDD